MTAFMWNCQKAGTRFDSAGTFGSVDSLRLERSLRQNVGVWTKSKKIFCKNVEKAELDAYLKRIRFSLNRVKGK